MMVLVIPAGMVLVIPLGGHLSLTSEYNFIIGVNLRKRAGQDNATMVRLDVATGEVVVVMEDDLQHGPSDIVAPHREIECEFEVACARFEQNSRPSGRISTVGVMIGLRYGHAKTKEHLYGAV
jgi:hypothetical protein